MELSKVQQMTIRAVIAQRQHLVDEANKVVADFNQCLEDLARRYAADQGEERPVLIDQSPDGSLFLTVKEEPSPQP